MSNYLVHRYNAALALTKIFEGSIVYVDFDLLHFFTGATLQKKNNWRRAYVCPGCGRLCFHWQTTDKKWKCEICNKIHDTKGRELKHV